MKTTVDSAFGDKILSKASIYKIVKKVKAGKNTIDQRHLNATSTPRRLSGQNLLSPLSPPILPQMHVPISRILHWPMVFHMEPSSTFCMRI